MTCIVAVKHKDKTVIGADSCTYFDNRRDTMGGGDRKIFKVGELLFAGSGTGRCSDLVSTSLKLMPQKAGTNDLAYLKSNVAPRIYGMFKANGLIYWDKKRGLDKVSWYALILYRNNIYLFDNDFSIEKSANNYQSIGSGAHYALGSLATSTKFADPQLRVRKALEVAEIFEGTVRGPFVILDGDNA